ncbi:sigma-70 family RNA polymerase sigma factor [Petralouisia muris]|jgi:RNA polymerase sigma-70 factor (ECF subfamily)|uniref:Sigma-70 family RNA polymerase sigma factor n=1 Tax=Petralouisia muris TaxID=3032872 RepID=A0AC61RUY8_9FIRM|nr:sigma-70 family RNA polymerase sigma factor [Petralouisia muris]TGY95743.1 sigma-70 family RNA polymerase sigma factor [Petralouisia muris]
MEEFMRCYEKIYPQMYRTAWFYLQNQQEAEDAVQDAVLAAYEKFYQLKEKDKFGPWIMKILANKCKKRMQAWFRREEDIEDISPAQEKILAKETDFAMASAVKQVFEELEEEERFIVALSVLGGYTSEEISDILNKNHSTIRSKYRRALQKMKKKLEV